MLEIKKATSVDYPAVRKFYYDITDDMAGAEYAPGWEKDVYPDQPMLIGAIDRGEMYMAYENDALIACMIVNSAYNEGYKNVKWSVEASDDELLVIHALGVRMACTGRGIARKLVRYVIDLGRSSGKKAVRLDVLKGNLPAEHAYESIGFRYVDTITMYYADTGWTDYKAYEYII